MSLQLKQNGWIGNFALGASYISLPWCDTFYCLHPCYTWYWQLEINVFGFWFLFFVFCLSGFQSCSCVHFYFQSFKRNLRCICQVISNLWPGMPTYAWCTCWFMMYLRDCDKGFLFHWKIDLFSYILVSKTLVVSFSFNMLKDMIFILNLLSDQLS